MIWTSKEKTYVNTGHALILISEEYSVKTPDQGLLITYDLAKMEEHLR